MEYTSYEKWQYCAHSYASTDNAIVGKVTNDANYKAQLDSISIKMGKTADGKTWTSNDHVTRKW